LLIALEYWFAFACYSLAHVTTSMHRAWS